MLRFWGRAELRAGNCLFVGAPSALPEEEVAVSLPDGFFSEYEAKTGQIFDSEGGALRKSIEDAFLYREEHEPLGELVINLDQVRADSPYVYETDGLITVSVDGNEQIFSMDSIDYVCNGDDDDLCYRLACTPESGCGKLIDKVYALCYSCKENQSVLVGTLSYFSQKGELEVSYPFFITGRNEFEAERHLQKRITVATAY